MRARSAPLPSWRALTALLAAALVVALYGWVLGRSPHVATLAASPPLQVDWQAAAAAAGETQPGAAWQPYAAGVRLPRGGAGGWVRVRPAAGTWPDGEQLLAIEQPGFGAVSRFEAGQERERRCWSDGRAGSDWGLLGGIVFPLDADARRDGALLLRWWPHAELDSRPQFALLAPPQLALRDTMATLSSGALLATLAAFALLALPVGALLREPAFFAYALYLGSYALLQLMVTGLAYSPLPVAPLAAAPQWWGRLATGVAVWAATVFLSGFADLRRHAPRMRWLVLAVGWAVLLPTLSAQFGGEALRALVRQLINPLLMLSGPLLLLAAGWAWWRGSRYAGFFFVGWMPLLTITALDSASVLDAPPGTALGDYGALGAALFEAFVLMLGLGDRAYALRGALEQAHRLAGTDALTGLPNRRGWRDALQAQPADVIVYADLDHFKALNDRYGHAHGDEALSWVGAALKARLRRGDRAARYGGEEFVVALYDCSAAEALAWAEALRRDIARLDIDAGGRPLTLSIGVAVRRPAERIERWLERADAAMYAAKQGGRDRVVLAGDDSVSAAA
ncbi:GGDEF domain-containing protein [Solimonas variicoloris]|uniref:GGDEF domain-containing protein n=1 Tax=Solimonas variicoloris TaxID=254408 RepID=UPI0003691FCD|nr:diguanylate cyclase [Solimonas variicoloris]